MIPLSVPNLGGNEWQYIKDCLDTNWVSSVGSYVTKFEEVVADFCGSKYAIATSNGTAALHISLIISDVKSCDLVIVPNVTFVASINAIKYVGANPILIDIDEHTWQIDLDLLENFLKNETEIKNNQCVNISTGKVIKAIMPVHVLGNMCDMTRLVSLAKIFHLVIIEDSTEALGSYQSGKHAGTFGRFGTLSFNGNKLITTGGGGMILTDEESLAKRAKHLTTTAKSTPDQYYHDEVGYNYRLVNILAALGVAQMEQLQGFLKRKIEIREFYDLGLMHIEGFGTQKILKETTPNNWLYTCILPNAKDLITYLTQNKIQARPFWVPMNNLPANENDIYISNSNKSGKVYESCISLPCSTSIKNEELEEVIKHIKLFYGS